MGISNLHASHIKKVEVTFSISGCDIDPNMIESMLGIKADTKEKTKVIYSLEGTMIGRREGYWAIGTEGKVDSKDINDHFSYLLAMLLPKSIVIKELSKNWKTFFDVYWASSYLYAGTGPLFSKEICAGIAELNASMGFDIYQEDDDDEGENNND